MSEAGAGQGTNFNDESIHAHAPLIVFRPEYPKESPWKQPAVYVAALALILVIGGEWRRWTSLDDARHHTAQQIQDAKAEARREIDAVKADNRNYRNDISVWETDVFNRDKTIEAILVAHGIDMSKVGKLKPPPER